MAVEVIRLRNSIFPYEIDCVHCPAVLRVGSVLDLKWEMRRTKKYFSVECPHCGRVTEFPERDQELARNEFTMEQRWRGG